MEMRNRVLMGILLGRRVLGRSALLDKPKTVKSSGFSR